MGNLFIFFKYSPPPPPLKNKGNKGGVILPRYNSGKGTLNSPLNTAVSSWTRTGGKLESQLCLQELMMLYGWDEGVAPPIAPQPVV